MGRGLADAVVGNVMAVESFLLRGIGLACEYVLRDVRSGCGAQGSMPPSCAILLIFIQRPYQSVCSLSYSFHVRLFQPFKHRHHITLPRWVNSPPERLE